MLNFHARSFEQVYAVRQAILVSVHHTLDSGLDDEFGTFYTRGRSDIERCPLSAVVRLCNLTYGICGSAQGQPIPVNGELLKDSEGNIVVSRLDEKILEQIARAGSGAYMHAGNKEFGLNPIINEIGRAHV